MTDDIESISSRVDRRRFLQGLGVAGAAAVVAGGVARRADAASSPTLVRQPDAAGAPPAEMLHLQFGAEASESVVASWSSPVRVRRPRVRIGTRRDGFGDTADAYERAYTDALTGETVYTYHAPIEDLNGSSDYTYEVFASGASPVGGHFRTGPKGRAPFRFSSFGDQAIPAKVGSGKLVGPNTPNAGFIVDAVEATDPLFHLLNGDLCYANVSDDPVATWRSFFANNMRSARNRPWMPSAGNHENEVGNGPYGMEAYRNWFWLPENGATAEFEGNWYSFRVGNVGVISLNNDDVCLQAGSFVQYRLDNNKSTKYRQDYLRGYSLGIQKTWLERTLRKMRSDESIDWIVVCMHQVAMSSAHFNGADLGIRQEWLPLFDRYGVDLVVAGHEHHYERSHGVNGADAHITGPGNVQLLTPTPRTSTLDVVDTTKGTVHVIIGGGGHSFPTPGAAFDAPHDGVLIYDVDTSKVVNGIGPRPAKTTTEPGDWSAFRDVQNPYGFCTFDVDPGTKGGKTSITVNYHAASAGSTDYSRIVDSFRLERPRSDTNHSND
jgi:hypothetical protein